MKKFRNIHLGEIDQRYYDSSYGLRFVLGLSILDLSRLYPEVKISDNISAEDIKRFIEPERIYLVIYETSKYDNFTETIKYIEPLIGDQSSWIVVKKSVHGSPYMYFTGDSNINSLEYIKFWTQLMGLTFEKLL